jgi:hypothetical protein
MKTYTSYLTFNARQRRELIHITGQVEEAVRASGIQEGLMLVSAMHITAGVFVNDHASIVILCAGLSAWHRRIPFMSTTRLVKIMAMPI